MNTTTHTVQSHCLFTRYFSLILFFSLCLPILAHAHRGKAVEIDECRIRVGSDVVHFSAYTPTFTEGTSYCQFIPNVGLTNLVFDYEGQKLRNMTVELEITRDSDDKRIFYQAPKKIKSGTINTVVDFSQYGAGSYLAHITIIHRGEKLDSHLGFTIGAEEEEKTSRWITMVLPGLLLSALIVFMLPNLKQEDDQAS